MSDITMGVLHGALDGLMQRQRVVADNIANLSTPGFRASQVNFEDSLRSAMSAGTPPNGSGAVVTPTSDAVNANGNNVSLDGQTMTLAETELRYQAVIDAVNAQFRIIHTSIQG